MKHLGFKLQDVKEHEFIKQRKIIAFAEDNDLFEMAKINPDSLVVNITNEARFKELSVEEYLTVYKFMLRDNYRQEKLEKNDQTKIRLIEKFLKERLRLIK